MPRLKVAQAVSEMRRAGYQVRIVADMCEMALQEPDMVAEIARGTVVGCHKRALAALFDSVGVKAERLIDLRGGTVGEVLGEMGLQSQRLLECDEEVLREIESLEQKAGQDAWYPLLDAQKCVNCGKCHDFCLFGVYTMEQGEVSVANPTNCKNNCPACARVCPVGAVIFAKHDEAPINGGEAQAGEGATFKVDMNAVYNEALRERLQHRRASVLLRKEKK